MNAVTETTAVEPVSGVEIFVPLAKLKKSPRNASKVPHGEAAIEALAASIAARCSVVGSPGVNCVTGDPFLLIRSCRLAVLFAHAVCFMPNRTARSSAVYFGGSGGTQPSSIRMTAGRASIARYHRWTFG